VKLEESTELYDVYEVFVQTNQLEGHQHVGSVLAPDGEMALQLARENFLRRDAGVSIWCVKKSMIHATSYEDKDFFAVEFSRDYRRVDGYADNAKKWKIFKQRALHLEDLVKD